MVLKKTKMYIFTDCYPWGKGEKTFIEPEIDALSKEFDISIVSLASDVDATNSIKHDLSKNYEVLRWKQPSAITRFFFSFAFPFSKLGREEFANLIQDGFSFRRLLSSVSLFSYAKSLMRFCELNRVFTDENAIFYSFWFNTQCLSLVMERQKNPHLQIISRIHGYDLYNERNKNGRQPFQKTMRDNIDLLIFHSTNSRKTFETDFGHERSQGQYVINRLGVKAGKPTIAPACRDRKLIISCSSAIPLKRIDLIPKAIAQSAHKDQIHWIHFGDGETLEAIKEISKQLEINATFFGHVDNQKVLAFYELNPADAFILLSETEGSPVCIQEALAYAFPVIATNVGGVEEEIDANGVLLAANPSLDSITEAIDYVLFSDIDSRISMRARSLDIWEKKYNLSSNKNQLIDLVKDKFPQNL